MQIRFVDLRARIGYALMLGYVFEIGSPSLSQSTRNIDRFLGKWKEDESKMQLGSEPAFVFRRGADGQLEELVGGQVSPRLQPVIFDGKPRVGNPKGDGRTVAWTQQDQDTFQRILADKDGHVLLTRTLRLSSGGQTLVIDSIVSDPAQRAYNEMTVREREGKGGPGLIGTWKMKSYKTDNPQELTFERAGSSGLKLFWATGQVDEVTLTGKPAAPSGPNVLAGTMKATKLMPNGSIEEVVTRYGEPVTRRIYAVSPDGRTMTRTALGLGKNATDNPSVFVYQKQ
jgi:hypothetical protein